MTCDILIRSYWRDRDWLELCLRSIDRYCTGFRDVVVVVPERSRAWFERFATPMPTRWCWCEDVTDDYLGQQVTKLYADELTDAELICHVDSDCLFRRPTSPTDLAPAGRPRIYTRAVSELPRHWPWTAPTEEILGWRVTCDFMQCPPFTFPAWLYPEVRAHTLATHGLSLRDWVLAQPERGCSEFNILGAYAYERHAERFSWVRVDDIGEEERAVDWYWSREPPDHARSRWLATHGP